MSSGVGSIQARASAPPQLPSTGFESGANSRPVVKTAAAQPSFGDLERWNKTPARAQVDSMIRENGGASLSAQDMELVRRHVFLNDGGAKELVAQLNDPQAAPQNRARLWADQAERFGGNYLPAEMQAKQAKAESLVRAPAPIPAAQPEAPASSPLPPQSEQIEGSQQVEQTEPSDGQADAMPEPVRNKIENEFMALVKSSDNGLVSFRDIRPILEKDELPKDYLSQVEGLLKEEGNEDDISFGDFTAIRIFAAAEALGQQIKKANPRITDEAFEAEVQKRLFDFILKE